MDSIDKLLKSVCINRFKGNRRNELLSILAYTHLDIAIRLVSAYKRIDMNIECNSLMSMFAWHSDRKVPSGYWGRKQRLLNEDGTYDSIREDQASRL